MKPKNPEYKEVMNWIHNQENPSVDSLNKYLLGKELWKNQAKSIARSYRYIIDMVNNVKNYGLTNEQ